MKSQTREDADEADVQEAREPLIVEDAGVRLGPAGLQRAVSVPEYGLLLEQVE